MSEDASRHLKRNFALGVANGVVFMAGSSLLSATTILPTFLENVFRSKALIGVGAYLLAMGWNLPQIVVAYFVRAFRYRKPIYIYGNLTRMAFIGAFVACIYFLHDSPRTLGILFFVLLGCAGLAAGTVGLVYQDIVARTIPANRRGAYNAYRIFGGQGVAAIASSLVAKWVLDHPERFPYPLNYVLIFGVAWACMTSGTVIFSLVREPPDPVQRSRQSFRIFTAEVLLVLRRNRNYRLYLLQRLLRACEGFAIPYYVLFAKDALGLGDGAVGTFQIVGVVTVVLAAIWWGRISDSTGNRSVITLSSIAAAAAPLAALGVAWANRAGAFAGARTLGLFGASVSAQGGTLATLAMGAVFVLVAAAGAGSQIGFPNYIMDTAPARRRQTYLGLTTTYDGILLIVLPAVGGLLIEVTGYAVGFLVTLLVLAASVAVSTRLHEPRQALQSN